MFVVLFLQTILKRHERKRLQLDTQSKMKGMEYIVAALGIKIDNKINLL